MEEMT